MGNAAALTGVEVVTVLPAQVGAVVVGCVLSYSALRATMAIRNPTTRAHAQYPARPLVSLALAGVVWS